MRVMAVTLVDYEDWIRRLLFIFIFFYIIYEAVFIFILDGPLDLLEVCDNERVSLRKDC